MSYASFKLDGISDALYQHHEYYASLHKLLRQLGIADCQDLCAKVSLAQFKLYQKINRDLKIEEKNQRRGIALLSNPHTEDN